ncbi:MAG TPA: hypothetical protein VML95_11730 [Longimicrobiales bacterium]|nr:hypothetical protein [Longimicrobiales bacterium]
MEAVALAATELRGAYTATFDWSLRDRDARFSGEGAARVSAPAHARLDLFGPRGEFFLAAALVGDDLRIPPGARSAPLPPPELFWAVLGVLRRPSGAALAETRSEGAATVVGYVRGEERWSYRVEGPAVRAAEWTGGNAGRMTVEVRAVDGAGRPSSVRYRDWPAFVELVIDVTELVPVEGHPDETWDPSL